jgi:hypothetical protein
VKFVTHHRAARWLLAASLPAASLLAAPVRGAGAQPDCYPPASSNEARTMALVSMPISFSALQAPELLAPGTVRVTLETSQVPHVSASLSTASTCRPGKDPEDANLLSVIPRPRVLVALPYGLMAEGGWIPPVRVADVRSNVLGLALSWSHPLTSATVVRVRASGTTGWVEAPITCNEERLQEPESECYQGTPSTDRLHPNMLGADAAVGWSAYDGRLRPYAGAGYNHLRPRFHVDFTNRAGTVDNTRVIVELHRFVAYAGADWRPLPSVAVVGEAYASASDGVIARLGVSYVVR